MHQLNVEVKYINYVPSFFLLLLYVPNMIIRKLLVLTVHLTEDVEGIVNGSGESEKTCRLQGPSFLPTREDITETSPRTLYCLSHGGEEADVEDVGHQEEDGRHCQGIEQVAYNRLVFSKLRKTKLAKVYNFVTVSK